jgi:hypothetical protein
MVWFRNDYECIRCHSKWSDEWSCMCDDECGDCGARDISPYGSDDLTYIMEQREGEFIVLRSPDSAEHAPDYENLASFATSEQAMAYLKASSVEPATPVAHEVEVSVFAIAKETRSQ